jgi:hypothetical protein
MSLVKLVEDNDQTAPQVRAVFDDIKATRKVTWINNFWRALASHPPTLARIWANVKEVMAPGALDLHRRERNQQLRLLLAQPHRLCAQTRHERRAVCGDACSRRIGQ